MPEPFIIAYNTQSEFKREEALTFLKNCEIEGQKVEKLCSFDFTGKIVKETLEVDIETMVIAEARLAYQQLKVPCIVEHAGLIFDEYLSSGYPGGLTKPMWNSLGPEFIEETHSANRKAIARAVVGYCDGRQVHTFTGETRGTIATTPRGARDFYWDTVFVPDSENPRRQTYAEITSDAELGLAHKMRTHSQSAKALTEFIRFRLRSGTSPLWEITW